MSGGIKRQRLAIHEISIAKHMSTLLTRTRPFKSVVNSIPARALMALACLGSLSSWAGAQNVPQVPQRLETADELNQRLEQLRRSLNPHDSSPRSNEYIIGPEDLLDIAVFEAPELNRSVRVSASGEIALTLVGPLRAAGLSSRELESVLQELLRHSYIKDPHVTVFVREIHSHAVSVFGAVRKPGVMQIRGPRSLVEILSMAEGLAEDAGDTVLVIRGPGLDARSPSSALREPSGGELAYATHSSGDPTISKSSAPTTSSVSVEIEIKQLLESADPQANVTVNPGDLVKVSRAGVVYVVGEVRKPGGFLLKNNENISALQVIALAEGLTRTSAKNQARIIRNDAESGGRSEIPLPLAKILAGKHPDLTLRPNDIVFVPNSAARSGFYRGAEAALSIVSGLIVFRR